jgi:hypothetical protein
MPICTWPQRASPCRAAATTSRRPATRSLSQTAPIVCHLSVNLRGTHSTIQTSLTTRRVATCGTSAQLRLSDWRHSMLAMYARRAHRHRRAGPLCHPHKALLCRLHKAVPCRHRKALPCLFLRVLLYHPRMAVLCRPRKVHHCRHKHRTHRPQRPTREPHRFRT